MAMNGSFGKWPRRITLKECGVLKKKKIENAFVERGKLKPFILLLWALCMGTPCIMQPSIGPGPKNTLKKAA